MFNKYLDFNGYTFFSMIDKIHTKEMVKKTYIKHQVIISKQILGKSGDTVVESSSRCRFDPWPGN